MDLPVQPQTVMRPMSEPDARVMFQIRDWNSHFENNKSRERDQCAFVCVPNKQHGQGFVRVVSESDGAAIYGVWIMILGAASRQRKPREGYLTHDGTPSGEAWTAEDMALQFRRPVAEVERALAVLSSAKVGWIQCHGDAVPAQCPPSACPMPLNRREEKGNEEKGRELFPSPPSEVGKVDDVDHVPSKPKKPKSEADPRHHEITSQWGEPYRTFHGQSYVLSGKDVSALKRFLASARDVTAAQFMERAVKAWAHAKADRFARQCARAATIAGLCDAWNDIVTEMQRPQGGQATSFKNGRNERGQRPNEIPTDVTADKIPRIR
jgi:hypothetical protein